jgi:hypothetical protein
MPDANYVDGKYFDVYKLSVMPVLKTFPATATLPLSRLR